MSQPQEEYPEERKRSRSVSSFACCYASFACCYAASDAVADSLRVGHLFVFLSTGSTHDFVHFELGRATKCPVAGSTLIAVATDTPEASQHFLAVLDAETMLKSARGDPLVCYLRLDQHLSDLRWLTDEMLIGCAGEGDIRLFQFDGQKVVHKGQNSRACSRAVI